MKEQYKLKTSIFKWKTLIKKVITQYLVHGLFGYNHIQYLVHE